jgi:hypothetical protein
MTQTPTRFSCIKCKSRICFVCFSKSKESITSHCSHCGQKSKIINKRKMFYFFAFFFSNSINTFCLKKNGTRITCWQK